jgi:dihydrolipoamide dehydrogenase
VKGLTGGIEFLFKKNKVEWIKGYATFEDAHSVTVAGQKVTAKNIVIATGSEVAQLPGVTIDEKQIVSSTGALDLEKVPGKLVVIGAGVIGLELGSVWRRLGSEVVVFEALDAFLPMADKALSKEFQKILKKQGLDIRIGAKVSGTEVNGREVTVKYNQAGEDKEQVFDKLIVCVGRKAYAEGLLAEDSGIKLTERGLVDVNDQCQTSVEGVYAIGDLVRGPMLAHKAMEECVMAVERIHGHAAQLNNYTIISVIYTHPEAAWVGLTEEQAAEKGHEVKAGQFPFAVNGRALAAGDTAGFVKFVADAKTDRLLGMHVVGPNASDIVHQGMIALEFVSSVEDLQLMTFGHPTFSEVVHEAALSVDGRAIHAIQRKRK